MRTWARIISVSGLALFACLVLILSLPDNRTDLRFHHKVIEDYNTARAYGRGSAYIHQDPIAHHLELKSSNTINLTDSDIKKLAPWDGRVYDKHVQPGNNGRNISYVLSPNIIPDKALLTKLQSHLTSIDTSFYCPKPETLYHYIARTKRKRLPLRDNWDRFYANMSTCDLYRKDSTVADDIIRDMTSLPIQQAVILSGGTQVKLTITFDNGKKALFKPLRYGIGYETNPNHFYFSDFERANAEIAAFHLDRLLDFRRVVPTVGRKIDLRDLKAKSEKSLHKTFFVSPAKNICFVSKCDYYCETGFAICGRPDTIYGSLQTFLPDEESVPRDHVRSPYRRTYSKRNQLADWQQDDTYCENKVKPKIPFASLPRRLLDLVDMYIFDFLQGNLDRHHYEVLDVFDETAYPIHLDNGRGFGKPYEDAWGMDILAPLYQCCVIRPATLQTLLQFYAGPKHLSVAMHQSMSKDPMAPVLTDAFFAALDRRVEIIIRSVAKCIEQQNGNWSNVIRNEFSHPNPEKEEEEEEE